MSVFNEYWEPPEYYVKQYYATYHVNYDNNHKIEHGKWEYHNEHGPSIFITGLYKKWYQYGKLHRDDGPAIDRNDGYKFWYKHGKLHRDNGPAIILGNGVKVWYNNGEVHRTDGPAIEKPNGSSEWFYNGKRHRENGPAIIDVNNDGTIKNESYYIHGQNIPLAHILIGKKYFHNLDISKYELNEKNRYFMEFNKNE